MSGSIKSFERRGIFYAISSGICYGLMGYFGMSIVYSGASVYSMMFWRFLAASLITTPLLFKYRSHLGSINNILRIMIGGGSIYCLGAVAYFLSGKAIGTGLAMVIFYVYPIFVVLINRFVYKTPISSIYYIAITMILVGLWFLTDINELTIDLYGIFFSIMSALIYAIYILFSKNNKTPPVVSTFFLSIGCMITALILASFEGGLFFPKTAPIWFDIIGIGIVCTAIPILLLLESMRYISSEKVSIFSASEPIFTVIFGIFLLDETINANQIIGIMLLLGGAMTTLVPRNKDKKYES